MAQYEELSANIQKICQAIKEYKEAEKLSYTKAADRLSVKLGHTISDKNLERLAKGEDLDRFTDKLLILLGCGELFGINLVPEEKTGGTVTETNLKRIDKIIDELDKNVSDLRQYCRDIIMPF